MSRRPKVFYGYPTVAIAFFVMMVTYGTYYSFGVFLKPLLEDFQLTRAMTAGAFSVASILQGVLAIVSGGITDRYGPRPVLTVAGVSYGVGCILMSQVAAPWQLYLFYALAMGVGMAGPFSSLAPTIARWFVRLRGLMTGIVVSGVGIGTIMVPPLATFLITAYNWRVSYLVMGAVILVVVTTGAQFLRKDPSQKGQLPLGGSPSRPEQGVAARTPGNRMSGLLTWKLGGYLSVFLCYGVGLSTVMVHAVPYATDLGIPPISAAGIIAMIGASSTVGKIFMGWASDRIGGRWSFVIAFAGMTVSVAWLMMSRELWMFLVFGLVFGFTYSGMVAPQAHFANELFGTRSLGLLFGMAGFVFTIGGSAGSFFAGYLFDVNGNYQTAFTITAGMLALGIVVTLLLRPSTKRKSVVALRDQETYR